MKKGLTQILLIMMFFALPGLAFAEPAVWKNHSKRLELSRFVDYLQEPSDSVSLDSVRQLPESEWRPNGKDSVSLGYGDDVYWFRVHVRNPGAATDPLFLEIGYPVLDHVEVYLVDDGDLLASYVLGDKQPFYNRLIYHRNFLVPFSLSVGNNLSVYLRVDTTSSMQVPLTLWDQDAFYVAEQSRSLFEGIYYGIVLVMILYNLFVYMAVGERSFLHYVGYISAMPLFLASLHGVAFQYLWPEATWWNDQAIIVFLNLVVLFGGTFSLRFINVSRANHPVLNRLTVSLIVIAGVMATAGLLVPYRLMILPTILVGFLGCTTMLVLSIVRWVRKDPAARYYALAWVFMLFGGIVLALSKFTMLPRNLLTENATQVGSAIGVILLSVALADRLNKEKKRAFEAQQRLLQEERKARMAQEKSLRIQQEANTLLEQRVQERTRDLESLNARLRELSATDSLTGLKNRGHFDRAFSSAVVKAYRFGQPLSLLLLDIDHFKKFNDVYGHLVGDDCLQMVANCIRQYVTRPQDLAARYGGEEFVVLLPDTPEEGALRVAEKIRSEIEETGFRVSEEVLHLTVSIGVCAVCPSQADATKDIFCWADEALYEAKGRGRNQVVASEPPPVQGAESVIT
ncbi:diguanylate cyclase [Marinobacter sp. 71-i]|uniref:diguanylate cyclase n=1 Tax=Marinobacter iranensis TaxID=2962607 RepID=A0ABT5YBK4_9GAMM|nr:7TM diverse intracellular signaling domain-containing protein [Marinobacter iranensis]MDF0751058.1 diguanylate cyclase [Marinobacter iranensis]